MISSVTLCLSGGPSTALPIVAEHPAFLKDTMMLSGAAAGGHWFIYSQVKAFGALVYAATMNGRQSRSRSTIA